MKLLVTGGAGFVGSHLCEHFAGEGFEVIALDNLKRGEVLGKKINSRYNVDFLKSLDGVEFVRGDITRFSTLKEASTNADVIIHTAAQVAVTTSLEDPRRDFEINAIGTFNVLEAARLNDCAVLYCSTNKVYGDNVNHIPIRELDARYEFADDTFKDGIPETFQIDHCEHTPYGSSKLAGDIYVQDYAHLYGLKTGVFRMSCIYGTRQFGVEDQGWVAWFTIAALTGKQITIYGDGKQVRDVLYVTDLVAAFDAFLKSGLAGEVFNIGGGPENTLSLLELIEILERLTGREITPRYDDWRPSDQKVYVSSIGKARKLLGWRPRVSPEEGVEEVVSWVMKNRDIL